MQLLYFEEKKLYGKYLYFFTVKSPHNGYIRLNLKKKG